MNQETGKKMKEEKDFISTLPNDILQKFLSLLPNKEAVATCGLCRRWHDLWKTPPISLPRLDFNDVVSHKKPNPNPNEKRLFIQFVDKVLHSVNLANVTCVNLSLLGSYSISLINNWLRDACMHNNIVKLEVYVNFDKDPIRLPREFYTCTSLVVLKLNANVILDINSYNNLTIFPSLKVLHIFVHNPQDFDLTRKLYGLCPVLEDLFLESLMLPDAQVQFNVCSPTLKRLRIELTLTNEFADLYNYSFLIKTENLEWLDVSNNYIVDYHFEGLNVLDRANVRIGNPSTPYYGENLAFEFLVRLSQHVRSLSISGCTMWILSDILLTKLDEDDFMPDINLPDTFTYLTNLELGFQHFYSWSILPNILESSPLLEFLALEKEILDEVQFDSKCWQWREPDPVPSCMLNCLRQTGIKGFQGKQYELTVVEFLLRNALVLEKMIICFPPLSPDEETMLCKTILEYPRRSVDCQILFFSNSSLQP